MKEIWKPIKGYEGKYEVSNLGRVKSLSRYVACKGGRVSFRKSRYLKFEDNHGYKKVSLCKECTKKEFLVHRLVAEAFVPNPENKPEINHKDGARDNNIYTNLEWVTHSENIIYSRDVLHRYYHSTPVICVETGKRFESTKAANEHINHIHNGHISECCKGKRQTVGGYHWRYADE